jgi:hypothetical protein
MKKATWLVSCGVAAVLLCSCERAPDRFLTGHIGKSCTVQFRRNALGGAATLPVPPTTNAVNGADVSLSGALRSVEERGIIIESGKRLFWIPTGSILIVELEN